MAIRIRITGEIVCAAKSRARKDDTYVPDGLHYELSVIQKVLIPSKDEAETGRWYWLHGWCNTSEHPDDVPGGSFCKVDLPPRKLRPDPLAHKP